MNASWLMRFISELVSYNQQGSSDVMLYTKQGCHVMLVLVNCFILTRCSPETMQQKDGREGRERKDDVMGANRSIHRVTDWR